MNEKCHTFLELSNLFSSHGYHLYLVGGTVRDILLNVELTDMDTVTDATPEQMKIFLDGDYTFSKFGSVKYKINNVKFDITTLRKESKYDDHRHPLKIKYIKKLKDDHYRRDFTINAMYMDSSFKLYDYENGLDDLNNRVLKMVGNPKKRIKEDPLRILRAIRFYLTYDLTFDKSLKNALIKSRKFINYIPKDKYKMECDKMINIYKNKCQNFSNIYSIDEYIQKGLWID